MNTQVLITTVVTLCSIGGWYVVLNKYMQVRKLLNTKEEYNTTVITTANPESQQDQVPYVPGMHIPGMGPAPLLGNVDIFDEEEYTPPTSRASIPVKESQQHGSEYQLYKRKICNFASILHLSGLSIITGVPFVNILVPTILWLLKKEQHPYLAKQGRAVINFQIFVTIMQFASLGVGVLLFWSTPEFVNTLFASTKAIRSVFGSGAYFAFNIFTFPAFVWGCIMMVRGAIASYKGASYSYPLNVQFIPAKQRTHNVIPQPEPQVAETPKPIKISFG